MQLIPKNPGTLGLTLTLTAAAVFSLPVQPVWAEALPVLAQRLASTLPMPSGNCQGNSAVTIDACQTSLLLSQATEKPDMALLAKASANFVQSDRYQTDSEMRVTAASSGSNLVSTARVKTVVQAPNKFRSDITFLTSKDAKKPVATVVSDGKQVWMYRSDLNQYAVMSYQKFMDLDDNYWIGMSSLWFLQMPGDVRTAIAKGALSDPAVQKEMGLANDNPIKGGTETIDGEALYLYEYADESDLTIRAAVDPTTATLRSIMLTGKAEGFDIVINEQIDKRIANPSTTARSFQFSPPKGSKKVDTLAIGPL